MPTPAERAIFVTAHIRWAKGNLAGFLDLLAEDILYTVNVDGLAVPYAASALGKEDVGQRLELLLHTFTVDKFEPESFHDEADRCRSVVVGHYTHRTTGEVLRVKVRFRVWFRDNLIARMSEHHDAPYVEAFERLVFHLKNAAEDK